MMRRCILEFSSGQPMRRVPRQITNQMPCFLYSRKDFSASPPKNVPQGPPSSPTGKPPESGSNLAKFVVGSVAIGAAVVAAYQTGYIGHPYGKEGATNFDFVNKISNGVEGIGDKVVPNNQESRPNTEHFEKNGEALSNVPHIQDPSNGEGNVQVEGGLDATTEVDTIHIQQKDLPSFSNGSNASVDQNSPGEISSEDSLHKKEIGNDFTNEKSGEEESVVVNGAAISQETETNATSAHHPTSEGVSEDSLANVAEPPSSLLDTYFLQEKDEGSVGLSSDGEVADDTVPFTKENKATVGVSEELKDAYISKDGKLVLDFLQAIHAAEKRQAELDAHIFAEEKMLLKEKYEKELKDARARELMYAEEAAILDKELNRERTKAAATVKSLQEKAEENLKMELERKENEAELQLKKVQDLAKAELAAAIASEKASQIEKMAEANLHINALCMAFYARSEEARQSHSVHKLALGALALEDALSKGLPIQTEIAALHSYLEGIDRDSLLGLVLSSLPEETLNSGTDTPLQLNEKFDALKGTLRHYSLIPPGGGGILAHTLAHIASWLKMKEDDQSGDGIESIINRVDSFLSDGKLVEAADALEGGVSGSQAEEIIGDWVRRARNRAITEQALSLLQSYATSIGLT